MHEISGSVFFFLILSPLLPREQQGGRRLTNSATSLELPFSDSLCTFDLSLDGSDDGAAALGAARFEEDDMANGERERGGGALAWVLARVGCSSPVVLSAASTCADAGEPRCGIPRWLLDSGFGSVRGFCARGGVYFPGALLRLL